MRLAAHKTPHKAFARDGGIRYAPRQPGTSASADRSARERAAFLRNLVKADTMYARSGGSELYTLYVEARSAPCRTAADPGREMAAAITLHASVQQKLWFIESAAAELLCDDELARVVAELIRSLRHQPSALRTIYDRLVDPRCDDAPLRAVLRVQARSETEGGHGGFTVRPLGSRESTDLVTILGRAFDSGLTDHFRRTGLAAAAARVLDNRVDRTAEAGWGMHGALADCIDCAGEAPAAASA